MSAIDAAVERGKAAQGRKPKWEPVGVEYPGWLTALVERVDSGEVEGVFYAQGNWQFRRLGKDKDGKVKSYTVREKELKKIVKAMIGQGATDDEWRAELLEECAKIRGEKASGAGTKRRRRRRGKQ